MSAVPFVQLNDGNCMPALGLGTCASSGSEIEKAVKDAIDVGYRHIDTAWAYENEHSIGKAVRSKIAEGAVKRSDMFIVTKLWNTFHEPHQVERACRQSLNNLQLDYIDLYLIHFPFGYAYKNDHEQWPRNPDGTRALSNVDFIDTWTAMERLVELGWVKSIGVSNFNSEQIARLLTVAKIRPVVNQVECSPTISQKKLTKFCKDRDIAITGFCPLGHPSPASKTPAFMYDGRVKAIADKYNKTPAQIGLRYLHELGVTPIPKSVRKQRMIENMSIFDFTLTNEEKQFMDSFNTGQRLVAMYDARKSPYWPYGIKF